jgi:ketosteroid isomerase-like protein
VKRLTLLVLCGCLLIGVGARAANDPKDEKAVMATLEAMAKATIDKDVPTLAKIYGDDLTYSHSSGMTQTKDVVLKAIRGSSEGWFMKFSDTTIRIYGDVALAKGITDFRNGQPGKLVDNHLNILWVLVRRAQGPYGWQIVARQTTRVEEPAAGRGRNTAAAKP